MKRPLFALATLLAITLAPAAGVAGPDAQVDASLTYHGVTMKLDHVLIVRHGNEENAPQPPELRIFLSDREIPLAIAASSNTLNAQAYARRKNFSGVVIVADPTGETTSAVTYLLHAPGLAAGTSVSSTNGDAFSQLHVGGGRASGTAAIDSDDLKLTATFDAPVVANPVLQDLKGAAAVASAPTQTMLACAHAAHLADMAALARLNSTARMQALSAYRAEVGDPAFLAGMKDEPDAGAVAKTVTRVIVRGTNASVAMGDSMVASLVREDGVWKCD